MRISDWSSDVCSSDLRFLRRAGRDAADALHPCRVDVDMACSAGALAATIARDACDVVGQRNVHQIVARGRRDDAFVTLRLSKYDLHSSPTLLSVPRFTNRHISIRSEEHTSELQSLLRISYAVFCLKKTKANNE